MPDNSAPKFRKTFRRRQGADELQRSAICLAQAGLAATGIAELHLKEILSVAIWKFTEADGGKFGCRYRSRGVIGSERARLQHEHVIPRRVLIEQMRANPVECEVTLRTAVGCLVTVDEHHSLDAVDRALTGWDRYRVAGIEVFDMATDPPTPCQPWQVTG